MDEHFIFSLESTLKKSLILLDGISSKIYTDTSIAPFYSSIGRHIRHILDFYTSIFKGIETNNIDLTARERDNKIETDICYAKTKIEGILLELKSCIKDELHLNIIYSLTDDLGQGKVTLPTNLYSILIHANSHTIHHYAIISYLLNANKIVINDVTFGYNPTSPIKVEVINR